MTTLHSKASTKPLLQIVESHLGVIEPLLGKCEPRLEIIEPCFGIIKPVRGLNTKPNLGNAVRIARKSAAAEQKTPLFDNTSAKAVVYLCSQSHAMSALHHEPCSDILVKCSFHEVWVLLSMKCSGFALK